MKKCIKSNLKCIGRDSREFSIFGMKKLCCLDEIKDEIDIAQCIVDAINDCSKDYSSLINVSTKLSYASSVINKNNEDNLMEVLPIVQRFSLLMYEYKEKILSDCTIGEIVCSFTHELQKWFNYSFLDEEVSYKLDSQRQSIVADINTVEMALGSCMMVYENTESLDDLFF